MSVGDSQNVKPEEAETVDVVPVDRVRGDVDGPRGVPVVVRLRVAELRPPLRVGAVLLELAAVPAQHGTVERLDDLVEKPREGGVDCREAFAGSLGKVGD